MSGIFVVRFIIVCSLFACFDHSLYYYYTSNQSISFLSIVFSLFSNNYFLLLCSSLLIFIPFSPFFYYYKLFPLSFTPFYNYLSYNFTIIYFLRLNIIKKTWYSQLSLIGNCHYRLISKIWLRLVSLHFQKIFGEYVLHLLDSLTWKQFLKIYHYCRLFIPFHEFIVRPQLVILSMFMMISPSPNTSVPSLKKTLDYY